MNHSWTQYILESVWKFILCIWYFSPSVNDSLQWEQHIFKDTLIKSINMLIQHSKFRRLSSEAGETEFSQWWALCLWKDLKYNTKWSNKVYIFSCEPMRCYGYSVSVRRTSLGESDVLWSQWTSTNLVSTVLLLDGNDGIAPGRDDRVEEPGQEGLWNTILKRPKNIKLWIDRCRYIS